MKIINKVKIRMYRYGLGDCFLLTFYGEKDKNFNMLIDCGVLSKSKDFVAKMTEVVNNIKDETQNTIDVLVATHEHWDHLSGFQQAKPVFDSMTIKKIWMGWTENPKDAFARKLKTNHSNKLKALTAAYDKIKNQPTQSFSIKQKDGHNQYLKAYESFFSFYGIDNPNALSASGTGEAFDTLRKRKDSEKVYLTPSSDSVEELKELPGVRFYILGPPKDEKSLKKMNPSSKESEIYEFNYNVSAGVSFCSALDDSSDKNKPFDLTECINESEARSVYSNYFEPSNDWQMINDDWLYSAGNLAIALDNSVNNTSLTFAVELIDSGKVLLFTADAQIGNWLSWSNYEWTVKNNGKKETVKIDDLLNRTVFYKVGHHGSHNATMKAQGLEKMKSKELIAMIPVDKDMAKAKNWKMPFKPLLTALEEKTKDKVIIMDEEYPAEIKKENKVKDGINELFYDVLIQNK
jgi:hypothetical protein